MDKNLTTELMRRSLTILLALCLMLCFAGLAQSVSPYAMMGDNSRVLDYEDEVNDASFMCLIGQPDGHHNIVAVVGQSIALADTVGAAVIRPDDTMRFMSIDPHANEYPDVSPYAYCMGDPINYIDPTGNIVIAITPEEQRMIINTLPRDARDFVYFNEEGVIDVFVLAQYTNESGSKNFSDLLDMASDLSYTLEVHLSDSFNYLDPLGRMNKMSMGLENDLDFSEENIEMRCRTGEWGYIGHTSYPGFKTQYSNSTNNNIQVYINSNLSEAGRADAFSHEAYGHAYLYMVTKGKREISSHRFSGDSDINFILRHRILRANDETVKNMGR